MTCLLPLIRSSRQFTRKKRKVNSMLFELPSFEHINVKDIEEATFWLQKYGDKARVIAGATDLLGLMKDRVEGPQLKIPEVLINIKTIPDLNRVAYDEESALRIGAAVTLNRLTTSDVIKKKYNILSQAARQVGTTQIRNMGTIAGNICQRPRCVYFRHPHFVCFKKGGSKCYAATGEHRYYHSILKIGKCVMAHPSDIGPVLVVALKAKAIIVNANGERKVPMEDFFLGPNHFTETILKSDEFLKAIQVPTQNSITHQLFLKERIRHSADFALSSVAIAAEILDGIFDDIRIVLGGIAPYPYRVPTAEEIVRGKRLSEELVSKAAEVSVEGAHPLPMNGYKVDLTKALIKRCLMSIVHIHD
jgi:xanthine dehydrogenase YagS FAD-binding subunit